MSRRLLRWFDAWRATGDERASATRTLEAALSEIEVVIARAEPAGACRVGPTPEGEGGAPDEQTVGGGGRAEGAGRWAEVSRAEVGGGQRGEGGRGGAEVSGAKMSVAEGGGCGAEVGGAEVQ